MGIYFGSTVFGVRIVRVKDGEIVWMYEGPNWKEQLEMKQSEMEFNTEEFCIQLKYETTSSHNYPPIDDIAWGTLTTN